MMGETGISAVKRGLMIAEYVLFGPQTGVRMRQQDTSVNESKQKLSNLYAC